MEWIDVNPAALPEGECLAINDKRDVHLGYIKMSDWVNERKNCPACYSEESVLYDVVKYIPVQNLRMSAFR